MINAHVAVILVNYNGVSDTIECISSIEKSSYKNFSIIVVDNCSSDNSLCILRDFNKYHDFTLVCSKSNEGFSAGNNIGILRARELKADYVWLLNNDTIVDRECLYNLLDSFENNIKCGAAIGKIFYEKQRDVIWYAGGSFNTLLARTVHWSYGKKFDHNDSCCSVTFATGCCLLIPMCVIHKIGMLDESYFLYEEDTDYCCRLIDNGYDIIYNPNAVIYHKVSASTGKQSPISQYYGVRNKYLLIKNQVKSWKKAIAYFFVTVQFMHRCLKNELGLKYVFLGMKGFLKKEKGKSRLL